MLFRSKDSLRELNEGDHYHHAAKLPYYLGGLLISYTKNLESPMSLNFYLLGLYFIALHFGILLLFKSRFIYLVLMTLFLFNPIFWTQLTAFYQDSGVGIFFCLAFLFTGLKLYLPSSRSAGIIIMISAVLVLSFKQTGFPWFFVCLFLLVLVSGSIKEYLVKAILLFSAGLS